jgi:hypothetical protein
MPLLAIIFCIAAYPVAERRACVQAGDIVLYCVVPWRKVGRGIGSSSLLGAVASETKGRTNQCLSIVRLLPCNQLSAVSRALRVWREPYAPPPAHTQTLTVFKQGFSFQLPYKHAPLTSEAPKTCHCTSEQQQHSLQHPLLCSLLPPQGSAAT